MFWLIVGICFLLLIVYKICSMSRSEASGSTFIGLAKPLLKRVCQVDNLSFSTLQKTIFCLKKSINGHAFFLMYWHLQNQSIC